MAEQRIRPAGADPSICVSEADMPWQDIGGDPQGVTVNVPPARPEGSTALNNAAKNFSPVSEMTEGEIIRKVEGRTEYASIVKKFGDEKTARDAVRQLLKFGIADEQAIISILSRYCEKYWDLASERFSNDVEMIKSSGIRDADTIEALIRESIRTGGNSFIVLIRNLELFKGLGLTETEKIVHVLGALNDTLYFTSDERNKITGALAAASRELERCGVADPSARCLLLSAVLDAAGDKPSDMMAALEGLPGIVRSGVTDPAQVYDLARAAFEAGGSEGLEILPDLIGAGLKTPDQISNMFAAVGSRRELLSALIRAGVTDPSVAAEIIDSAAGAAGGNAEYEEAIMKALPAIVDAGLKDPARIADVLKTAISAKYMHEDINNVLGAVAKFARNGITEPSDIGRLMDITGGVAIDEMADAVISLRRGGITDIEEIAAVIEETIDYARAAAEEKEREAPGISFGANFNREALIGLQVVEPSRIKEWIDRVGRRNTSLYTASGILNKFLPAVEDRQRLYDELGMERYIQFLGFLEKSGDSVDGRSIEDLKKLCLDVEKKKGIHIWERYSIETFEHLLKPRDSGRPVALLITAEDDWNGALHVASDMKVLMDAGYRVEVVETADESAIYKKLDEIPDGSIGQLHIYGHGMRGHIALSRVNGDPDHMIDGHDGDEWRRYNKKFKKGAEGFLHACSTGEGGASDKDNMVTNMAGWLPNVSVFTAPPIPAGSVLRNDNGHIVADYTDDKGNSVQPTVVFNK